MSNVFYHIYSATMEGCSLTKEADAEARRSWLCAGCRSPKPGVGAIGVQIRSSPGKEPLNAVVGWGVPIISKSLLDVLGNELVQRSLYLGHVYGPDGKELAEWATFRGKNRLIVRGSKHAGVRRCEECGRDVYFAMDKKCLYPAPPPGVELFESDMCGLVLSEEVFYRSGVAKRRGIWIDRLGVAKVPSDSLGELVYF